MSTRMVELTGLIRSGKGDAPQKLARRDELTRTVSQMRAAGMIAAVQPTADPVVMERVSSYRRPCFVCQVLGHCGHREPEVELAYAEALRRRGR